MITLYNDLYLELFEKANERLKELGITQTEAKDENGEVLKDENGNPLPPISSLEEYFMYLKDLVYGEDEEPDSSHYIFLKLPLDEEPFKINTNTRRITIPSSFKTNGLSVQGDVVAETVFFEVDRFYDATDLNEQNIAIDWEAANGIQGRSQFFIKDTESKADEDKIIFGWPITGDITEVSGNLKFSVRFYSYNSNTTEYNYVLNTIPETIKINAGLQVSEGTEIDESGKDIILRRVTNSSRAGIGNPAIPFFVKYDSVLSIDSTTPASIPEVIEEPIYLRGVASKKDAGNLTYIWLHTDKQYDSAANLYSEDEYEYLKEVPNNGIQENAYILTEEYIENISVYYTKTDNDTWKTVSLTKNEFDTNVAAGKQYYLLGAVYKITSDNVQAGYYNLLASNSYYGQAISVNKQPLQAWQIKGAETPKFEATSNLPKVYWMNEAAGDLSMIVPASDTTYNTISYKWQNKSDEVFSDIVGAVQNTYAPEVEGTYKGTVTYVKNNDIKTADTQEIVALDQIAPFSINVQFINGNAFAVSISREIDPKTEHLRYSCTNLHDSSADIEFNAASSQFINIGDGTYTISAMIDKYSTADVENKRQKTAISNYFIIQDGKIQG